MPIPPNNSSGTATVISSLPFTDTQRVDDAGTTYDVWYKYIPAADGFIGVWGFGDLTTYRPGYTIYSPSSPTVYFGLSASGSQINRPIYFPVKTGVTYYIWIWSNAGNPSPANVTVTVLDAPAGLPQQGDFLTNFEVDDDYEFPLIILRGDVDYTIRGYQQIAAPGAGAATRDQTGLPHGQQGNILDNGNFLLFDEQFERVKIYDKDFTELSNTVYSNIVCCGISKVLQKFYIVYQPAADVLLLQLSATGTVENTWTLPLTSYGHIAVNSDASILYYNQGGVSSIKRFDLNTSLPLSDLVSDTVGYRGEGLMYLEDDTILHLWHQETGTPRQVYVKQYNTSGTLLNTYDFGATWRDEFNAPRIGFALDSPTSFWICLEPEANYQISDFRNILISDGSTVTERFHVNYLFGEYLGAETATPEGRFGPEKNFPILVVPVSSTPATGTIIVSKVVAPVDTTSFAFTASGGLSPATFTLTNGTSQTFTPAAGTYGVFETTNPSYVTTYQVSNDAGNDNTAITVSGGETVSVTVTNTAIRTVGSGLYQVVSDKKNDTYVNPNGSATTTAIPTPFWETALLPPEQ